MGMAERKLTGEQVTKIRRTLRKLREYPELQRKNGRFDGRYLKDWELPTVGEIRKETGLDSRNFLRMIYGETYKWVKEPPLERPRPVERRKFRRRRGERAA